VSIMAALASPVLGVARGAQAPPLSPRPTPG
jgi:hypothetical protein